MTRKYHIVFKESASRDIERHKKSGQKKTADKVLKLIIECVENPKSGIGKPEQLKHCAQETWSRRINDKHRLVYEIDDVENVIFVLSAWGHYDCLSDVAG